MKFWPKSRLNYRQTLAVGTTGNAPGGTLAGRMAINPQGAAQAVCAELPQHAVPLTDAAAADGA